MLTLEGVYPGNWFIDKRDGNYCTIIQASPHLLLSRIGANSYTGEPWCLIPIQLETRFFSLMGFTLTNDGNERIVDGKKYTLRTQSSTLFRLTILKVIIGT
jgi:hypothetical protein